MRRLRLAARLALVSLPEAGSPGVLVARVLVLPVAVGALYLALASGGGRADLGAALAVAAAAGAMASTVAASTVIALDRYEGTWEQLTLATHGRWRVWIGRVLALTVLGLVTAAVTAAAGIAVVGLSDPGTWSAGLGGPGPRWAEAAGLLPLACVTAFGPGACLGAVSAGLRDAYLATRLAEYAMPLLCGVVAPLAVLPGWLQVIAQALPLTHVTEAARGIAAGTADWSRPAAAAIAGLAWWLLAAGLWRWVRRRERIHGGGGPPG